MTTDIEIYPLFKNCFKQSRYFKNTTVYLSVIISLTSLLVYTNIAQAHPAECMNKAEQAIFLQSSGIVCLQKIKVTDNSGTKYFKASLKWLGTENPNKFQLVTLDTDSSSEENTPSFSLKTGVLNLPRVDIPEIYGTNRYSVDLVLKQENDINIFELMSAASYTNPDYDQDKDWKPYAMLSTTERQAIKLLDQSLPYAQLANAIYSFDSSSINGWELVEQVSKDSGMQAGAYINRNTEELVIAFRGAEACADFFCSFQAIKESVLDLAADALLSFGTSGPQFRHAFNFAEDIMSRYPDYKIKVTGHSLGGGLAQAIGSTFGLETFAFNSAPVPNDFFAEHPTDLSDEALKDIIHVIADIDDPVSHADDSGKSYLNAAHVSPLLQLDFDEKEILPDINLDRLTDLYTNRFDKHNMTEFMDRTSKLLTIYAQGW